MAYNTNQAIKILQNLEIDVEQKINKDSDILEVAPKGDYYTAYSIATETFNNIVEHASMRYEPAEFSTLILPSIKNVAMSVTAMLERGETVYISTKTVRGKREYRIKREIKEEKYV